MVSVSADGQQGTVYWLGAWAGIILIYGIILPIFDGLTVFGFSTANYSVVWYFLNVCSKEPFLD